MVKALDYVRRQLSSAEVELTFHAARNIIKRKISEREIREAGGEAIVIEEYPDDKFSPSCLILGFSRGGRPLHILVSLADADPLRLITAYEPDPGEWINHTIRR